ncbi:hypothetical protein D9615_006009 [Tricholomella constricta]|uniref:Uncharacterized protein n=1 Tax=Tricholomella constricta TaxID=117010 RepID=A0A8H5M3B4_9AGAR|nr:hypothetical protein D9615_006009 [Tricholomella constricta]
MQGALRASNLLASHRMPRSYACYPERMDDSEGADIEEGYVGLD